jgi:tRNA-2-methylthio-N6-dimethylallyladenosine synthase
MLEAIEYSVAYLYTYSPRKGTPAMRWSDDIPEEIKEERLKRLQELQEQIYAKQRQAMLGEEVEILVEELNFKDSAYVKGRTRCWKNVLMPGDATLIGTLQRVKLHSWTNQTFIGKKEACSL